MLTIQNEGGSRNWMEWHKLQRELGEKYRKEKLYWHQKSRIQWLKKGDQNTRFFHAFTMQIRIRNYIERLVDEQGHECSTREQIEEERTTCYRTYSAPPDQPIGRRRWKN